MTTNANIMQVCEAITEALRSKGFFAAEGDDAAREGMIQPAVDAASSRLGTKLAMARAHEAGTHTVSAEGIPGMVTIVSQRRVGHGGKAGDHESVNPDFGVTWSMT